MEPSQEIIDVFGLFPVNSQRENPPQLHPVKVNSTGIKDSAGNRGKNNSTLVLCEVRLFGTTFWLAEDFGNA
jgi:hypothetical protein